MFFGQMNAPRHGSIILVVARDNPQRKKKTTTTTTTNNRTCNVGTMIIHMHATASEGQLQAFLFGDIVPYAIVNKLRTKELIHCKPIPSIDESYVPLDSDNTQYTNMSLKK